MASLTFQEAEKIIKESPKQAEELVFEYQQYVKTHQETPPTDYPESVKNGEVIAETYGDLRYQHEDSQMSENGEIDRAIAPQDLMGMPILAASFLQRPKIMEEDGNYQKIEEKLKKEWLKSHNAKDFSSEEGLNYLHGSLDDKTKPSVGKEAEEAFRNNPKFKKRTERYDKEKKKVYKNHKSDPQWLAHQRNMQVETNSRLELLEKNRDKKIKASKENVEKSQQEIIQRVQKKHQGEFAEKHPEKAKAYFERIEAEGIKREEKKKKSSSDSPDMRRVIDELRKSEMPPTQRPPSPGRPSSFGQNIGRGFDQIQRGTSNIAQGGSRIASQAGRAAAQAGRVAAQAAARGIMMFFATPPGWITLGVIIGVLIVVFLIVLIMGKDKQPAQQMTSLEASPSATLSPITPTEELTPPVAP